MSIVMDCRNQPGFVTTDQTEQDFNETNRNLDYCAELATGETWEWELIDLTFISSNLTLLYGSEIKKTRPCVIVSPNEMNCLKTVLIAPMTTKGFLAPSRVELQFQDKTGLILLDQLRSVDKSGLIIKRPRHAA